eukprot:7453556-Ditylum_brightwellii.AAC.1
MAKLGETIQPMKESFIVAYLNWEGAKEENMVVPQDIAEYREKHGFEVKQFPRKKSEKVGNTNTEGESTKNNTQSPEPENSGAGDASKSTSSTEGDSSSGTNGQKKDDSTTSSQSTGTNGAGASESGTAQPNGQHDSKDENKAGGSEPMETESTETNKNGTNGAKAVSISAIPRDGKFAAMAAKKRDIEGN